MSISKEALAASDADLLKNSVLVEGQFKGQCAAAREQGERMGKVTIFLNRTSHRVPAGATLAADLKRLLRVPILRSHGSEIPLSDAESFELLGGEAFSA